MTDRPTYVVTSLVYDDGTHVTFDVERRAEAITHDELLRLGVEHAREERSSRPGDVTVPRLDEPDDWQHVRDWALCFARDRLTSYEQLEQKINEQETHEDQPHGLDAGCKDCEASMDHANRRADERRRLLGLAVMAWVKTRWPELRVTTVDLERWCPVTDDELVAAVGGLHVAVG